MPDPQQSSSDYIYVNVPGQGVARFPAGTSTDAIEKALAPYKQNSTAKDIGIGLAKGAGRQAIDLGRIARMNPLQMITEAALAPLPGSEKITQFFPGHMPAGAEAMTRPEGAAQSNAALAVDLAASALLPGGFGAKGQRFVRPFANMLERGATGMGEKEAEMALARTAGRISPRNAQALQAEADAIRAAAPAGVKVTPKIESTAQKMKTAADTASGSQLSWPEVALIASPFGGKASIPMAALGAARMMARPTVRTGVAQGLYSVAPGLEAGGMTGFGIIAQQLSRLLGGEK